MQLMILVIIVLLVAYFAYHTYSCTNREFDEKTKEKVESGQFVYYKDFDKDWIVKQKYEYRKGIGYKYIDKPGCFIILLFHEKPTDFEKYDDIFAGDSKHMYERAHKHIHGQGNEKVYAEIRKGMKAYIKFIPCDDSARSKVLADIRRNYDIR